MVSWKQPSHEEPQVVSVIACGPGHLTEHFKRFLKEAKRFPMGIASSRFVSGEFEKLAGFTLIVAP
jgi:hypothetical protein